VARGINNKERKYILRRVSVHNYFIIYIDVIDNSMELSPS
jgi:hypothetical protein